MLNYNVEQQNCQPFWRQSRISRASLHLTASYINRKSVQNGRRKLSFLSIDDSDSSFHHCAPPQNRRNFRHSDQRNAGKRLLVAGFRHLDICPSTLGLVVPDIWTHNKMLLNPISRILDQYSATKRLPVKRRVDSQAIDVRTPGDKRTPNPVTHGFAYLLLLKDR
ncbi:Uncharacterized protein APZ42_010226 [Daphnia magna]|uniref:Uncharacterized protein n=1 Tax=Daphnia magna TaxID=35525 RepID=A0A164DHW0_9CRUS|nr:Uncharacterized protein APZ42_010226 [Daphnia magna]